MNDSTKDDIRRVLRDHGRLPVDIDGLGDGDDLFRAGMSSHASPDQMLTRQVFSSVSEMAAAVDQLRAGVA
jgi:acyl carrier protein